MFAEVTFSFQITSRLEGQILDVQISGKFARFVIGTALITAVALSITFCQLPAWRAVRACDAITALRVMRLISVKVVGIRERASESEESMNAITCACVERRGL